MTTSDNTERGFTFFYGESIIAAFAGKEEKMGK